MIVGVVVVVKITTFERHESLAEWNAQRALIFFFLTFFSSARIENEADRGFFFFFFGFSFLFLFGLGSQKVQISQEPMGKPWIWIDDVAEYQPLRNCKQASTCQKNDICYK